MDIIYFEIEFYIPDIINTRKKWTKEREKNENLHLAYDFKIWEMWYFRVGFDENQGFEFFSSVFNFFYKYCVFRTGKKIIYKMRPKLYNSNKFYLNCVIN